MTFRDVIARDVRSVFMNPEEFAELRTIRYDGRIYPDIPVSLQKIRTEDRQRLYANGMRRNYLDPAPGLYQAGFVLFCAVTDLGGTVPKHGNSIWISVRKGGEVFRKYKISHEDAEMGMLRLELEAIDE